MEPQPEAWIIAKFALLIVGLLLPGATVMRALRVPASVATSFIGSALALYVTVLALHFIGERISLLSLSVGLGAITLLAQLVHLRDGIDGTSSPFFNRLRDYNPLTGMGPWVVVYLIFGAAAIWRAWHEPLAGPDVEFRWSFLAEQMLRLGSLNFYPPQTVADFHSYFWVESIPPGASALHVWAYACADGPQAFWTMPAVLLQLWSVHELLWRLAERIGGVQAARFACLAAAACPLLTWSILIGQETGLTAIALVGGAYALLVWNETRAAQWAALVGIFATVGASAREYGFVFPALSMIGLVVVRANWQAWLAFGLAAAIALIWPLRIWLLTGNPFFSLPLGSDLPVNERFLAWINHEAAALGGVQSVSGWAVIARCLLLYAPLAFAGWWILVHATFRRKRFAGFGLVATGVMLALWAASVRFTNGGPFYSLPVTSPALVFGCLATGMALARYVGSRPKSRVSTTALACLFVIALLPVTLALPANPLRVPWREWAAFKAASHAPILGSADESVALVLRAMSGSSRGKTREQPVVLADGAGYQRRFLPLGIPVIPLWSPQADWLFDLDLPPADALRRWQESRVNYIIVTKWQSNVDFFNTRSRWNRPPFQVQLVGETPHTSVFSVKAVE